RRRGFAHTHLRDHRRTRWRGQHLAFTPSGRGLADRLLRRYRRACPRRVRPGQPAHPVRGVGRQPPGTQGVTGAVAGPERGGEVLVVVPDGPEEPRAVAPLPGPRPLSGGGATRDP